jgi:hypothetical protein
MKKGLCLLLLGGLLGSLVLSLSVCSPADGPTLLYFRSGT